jgi:hypothetical protein
LHKILLTRLDDPPLLPMEIAFAGQQSIPKRSFGPFQTAPLFKFCVIYYQNFLNEIRLIEVIDFLPCITESENRSAAFAQIREQCERMVIEERLNRAPPEDKLT